MSGLILHSYDASPFTQRALRMLGIKNLNWSWVETPMMPPKDDLLALTGGYRGTPVLQIGSDVFIDSQLIAAELERRYPQPSLFPAGNPGLAFMLVKWGDSFFRNGLKIILSIAAASWPEAFREDRRQLFHDIDFSSVSGDLGFARAQFRAHAFLLERQLADGRQFIGGPSPGLADAQAHPFVWLMRVALPEVAAGLLDDMTHLCAWERRVSELGEGRRSRIDAAEALAEAAAGEPVAREDVDPLDAQQLRAGMRVSVAPDDTRRGAVEGVVTVARPDEIAVRRRDPRLGELVVHFPRMGYRVDIAG
jgi:glutathione S-transferase